MDPGRRQSWDLPNADVTPTKQQQLPLPTCPSSPYGMFASLLPQIELKRSREKGIKLLLQASTKIDIWKKKVAPSSAAYTSVFFTVDEEQQERMLVSVKSSKICESLVSRTFFRSQKKQSLVWYGTQSKRAVQGKERTQSEPNWNIRAKSIFVVIRLASYIQTTQHSMLIETSYSTSSNCGFPDFSVLGMVGNDNLIN